MIHIRPMTPDDFDHFWPTFHSVVQARETYAYDPALTFEQARDLWLKQPQHTLIAEEDGKVLGSYYLKANAAGPGSHVCNCGYMVTDAARGRGVARLMCEHSQQLARDSGFLAMQFNSVVATMKWRSRCGTSSVLRQWVACPRLIGMPAWGWWIVW